MVDRDDEGPTAFLQGTGELLVGGGGIRVSIPKYNIENDGLRVIDHQSFN